MPRRKHRRRYSADAPEHGGAAGARAPICGCRRPCCWKPRSGRAGQVGDARLLDEAQALIAALDQRFYEAELHRVRGMVALGEGRDFDTVVANYDHAIDVARRPKSRFLELRATTSKARLYLAHGRRQPAHELLAPVYRSFTEGLDTADLVEARATTRRWCDSVACVCWRRAADAAVFVVRALRRVAAGTACPLLG